VRVRIARVTAVDAERKTVGTDAGEIGYDTLVYALGSTAADGGVPGVPGVAEHAHHLAGKQSALRLRARPADHPAGEARFAAGFEAAEELVRQSGLERTILR
jgi:NADH dehydrogenase